MVRRLIIGVDIVGMLFIPECSPYFYPRFLFYYLTIVVLDA